MSDVTQLLMAMERGETQAAEELLPLVYEELRSLAARNLAQEKPGQTLQPTALVHEAYLRLTQSAPGESPGASVEISSNSAPANFTNRRYFFAAAAQAMRRILIENARRKKSEKHGGLLQRHDAHDVDLLARAPREDLLALDEALEKLSLTDKQAAELVQLRYFAGLSIPEAAEVLEISPRSADRLWAYAKAFLHKELQGNSG